MENLDQYSKTNPFKVPEGYFENFEEQLKQKLEAENTPKWKIYSIKPFLAMAAGFLLLFSLWFFLLKQLDIQENITQSSNEQNPDIEYFESVNSSELIELIASEEFTNSDLDFDMEQDIEILIDQFDESNIIEAFN